MKNFSIDIIWAKVQAAIAAIGGYLGYFVGGVDGLAPVRAVLREVENEPVEVFLASVRHIYAVDFRRLRVADAVVEIARLAQLPRLALVEADGRC